MRALLLLVLVAPASAMWCHLETVKADYNKDFSFIGPWKLDTCTTLTLDHGKCTAADCPSRVKIEDADIIELAEALQGNKILNVLSIASNLITDEGAKAIAEALLENEALIELSLQGNQITDEGAIAIAGAVQANPMLSVLNLEHNQIGDEGGRALLDALKSNASALDQLHIGNNPMDTSIVRRANTENEGNIRPPSKERLNDEL